MLQSQRVRCVTAVAIAALAVTGCTAGAAVVSQGPTATRAATPLPTTSAEAQATPAATPTPIAKATPVVTPSTSPAPGERIVFSVPGANKQIFSQLADGSDYRQVTTGPGNKVCPALFPDAQTIVYCGDTGAGAELWTVKPDGSNNAQLTKLGGTAFFPAVSPDGATIAFAGNEGTDPSPEVYVVDAKTGDGLKALTSCAGGKSGCANLYPAWSPDGKKIAYTHQDDGDPQGGYGENEQIWVMNADGSHAHALTTGSVPKHQRADWSPDGKWIVYASGQLDSEGIWVMRSDGSNPTQLTGCKAADPAPCATGSDYAPTWSPDGTQIAFQRQGTSDRPIFIMNADGSDQHRLSPPDIIAGAPDWR